MIKRLTLAFILFFGIAGIANAEIYLESLENERYNLGEVVLLKGYAQEQERFGGDLEIKSFCGNESKVILYSVLDLDPGEKHQFSQEFPVNKGVSGVSGGCYFTVSLKGEGISEEKRSVDFTITNQLRVDGDIDIITQRPGGDVIVSGTIRKTNGLRVDDGSVALTLNGKVYGSGLSNGAFSYRISLPVDISSGEQTVIIKARDLNGNEGDGEVKFRVISVAEDLSISTDKDAYQPGENLIATVSLIDQSGKNIEGSSTVQLVDPQGNDALTKVVENGAGFEIFLDELTLPGTWILRAEGKGFEASKKFYVEEVKDKEIKVEENKVFIRNTGNVVYDDPIQIDLLSGDGEEFRIIKDTPLKPNQTIVVDLNDEVPRGDYDVKVGGSLITGNVVLQGSGIENLKQNSLAGYFALVFVFLFLMLVVITKGRRRFSNRKAAGETGQRTLYNKHADREDKEAAEKAVMRNREIARKKEERERKEGGRPLLRASKEDVDHMLNRIKKEVPVDSDKRKSSGNPFNIFD
ncbi:hypothetical protein HYV89_03905 [Candidatus Woesearchaeota archaeon]|nr:hypothetical protein [Candidatus Woesearchaeota archaeon]